MIRKLLFVTILILLVSCNDSNQKTELTIIGTLHFPTKNINADSIYNELVKINPDFILMEADSSVFNNDFSFKKTFDENEYNAVIKYKKEKPNINIRPIEFQGRNSYRKKIGIYSEAGVVFKKMNTLNNSKLFTDTEQKIWNNFEYYWTLSDSINKNNLKSLNEKSTDEIIDSLMLYQYIKLKQITENKDEFENAGIIGSNKDTLSLKDYYSKWSEFEGNLRNNTLYENILEIIKDNPNNRIVVLVGYKHRFYILKKLKEKEKKYNFEIKEFYQ